EANRSSGYQDINNRRAARGISTFDVANRFVLSGTYELPFGKNRRFASGVGDGLNRLVGGWQLNSLTTLQTGLALTPTMAASTLNNAGAYQLPNRICNGALPSDQRGINRWFDTNCFVAPPAGVYGNSGLEILRGPGLAQVDLAVLKNVDITERAKFQF